ncbi:hypothetical protein [Dyadobacter frigoris]|uniref:Uncharacterized protein n=1 Tax=Dyadobacter frigoris TaxID=2576211 RepID=A0A4U6CS29_9BACT|nr:hypothetical protein [Dyadobacter frigoris]TKT87390.1 hypothetical protein FDK13_30570 [Dyadobacter frigoris]
MARWIIMFIIGLIFFAIGLYLRISGDIDDSKAFVTVGLYLTIVWLIDSSISLRKEIKKLKEELEKLKNNN